ncbi:MAG: hypothetical protein PVJ21_16700 [Anaerolineales bacterium]|jgi:hypothetical protein
MTKRASHRRRWKRVEEKIASKLTEIFSDVGKEAVERIPILGRTGPDISYNEVKLIVDVKSRKEVPKSSIAVKGKVLHFGDMLGFRLADLPDLDRLTPRTAAPSTLVTHWLSHMHEWTARYEPDGISCVILHRPGMPVGNSTVIIHSQERNTLCQRMRSSSPAKAAKPCPSPASLSANN